MNRTTVKSPRGEIVPSRIRRVLALSLSLLHLIGQKLKLVFIVQNLVPSEIPADGVFEVLQLRLVRREKREAVAEDPRRVPS